MGILRSVGGRGEVDLDQRAITTEDDIVDLSELDRSDEQPNQLAPATRNGAAGRGELGEGRPPATTSQSHPTSGEAPLGSDSPGRESDEDFDRWVGDRASGPGVAVAASKQSSPLLTGDAREPAPGDAPTPASGIADVPCSEATVQAVTGSSSRQRQAAAQSRPPGRLTRQAAAIAAVVFIAGGTAIAINAATTDTPHARPGVATSSAAALIAGRGNRAGATRGATIATVSSKLGAVGRAVPPARHDLHLLHKPPHRGRSHHARISNHRHPTVVGGQRTASAQTSTPSQTYASTPAPAASSGTSQATAGSQTQATSTTHATAGSQSQATSASQPAFGQNGTLGPGRGAANTQ